MGRTYAGILGAIGFLTVVARGIASGGGLESTLKTASASLFVLAAVGAVVGQLAAWIVDESVRVQVHSELLRSEANKGTSETERAGS